MSVAEVATFERERFFADAVSLRRWDGQGPMAGAVTPALSAYHDLILNVPGNELRFS
jgi:predicted HD phosphohydrolase